MATRCERLLLLGAMCAVACMPQAQWRPTVDTYGSSRAQYVSRDEQECRQLAIQVSGWTPEQVARGAIGGGLLGAAAGAAIGATTGSAGRGAKIGAAAGGVGGGVVAGVRAEEEFRRAFIQCMRNRGHTVLD